ncbi:MAG: hypothetical protein KAJ55_06610 [Anaerolineales bacterium]|nr:hypothetical protein [Anaerolineales bacterium]
MNTTTKSHFQVGGDTALTDYVYNKLSSMSEFKALGMDQQGEFCVDVAKEIEVLFTERQLKVAAMRVCKRWQQKIDTATLEFAALEPLVDKDILDSVKTQREELYKKFGLPWSDGLLFVNKNNVDDVVNTTNQLKNGSNWKVVEHKLPRVYLMGERNTERIIDHIRVSLEAADLKDEAKDWMIRTMYKDYDDVVDLAHGYVELVSK